MNQKRINLCFDLDDEAQNRVYKYLQFIGKGQKTSVVVSAIKTAMATEKPKASAVGTSVQNNVGKPEAMGQLVRIIQDAGGKQEAQAALQGIRRIEESLNELRNLVNTMQRPVTPPVEKTGPTRSPAASFSEEINDDAFSAVMSLFG